MLERHMMHGLDACGAVAHDVAEPAHHRMLGEAQARAMDAGVDDRVG